MRVLERQPERRGTSTRWTWLKEPRLKPHTMPQMEAHAMKDGIRGGALTCRPTRVKQRPSASTLRIAGQGIFGYSDPKGLA
jgi:hypothetical protein